MSFFTYLLYPYITCFIHSYLLVCYYVCREVPVNVFTAIFLCFVDTRFVHVRFFDTNSENCFLFLMKIPVKFGYFNMCLAKTKA